MGGRPAKVDEKKGDRDLEREISSIKRELRSFWTFHVAVLQNRGKEMYKKSVLHVQSCFLLIRPIVVFHRSPALPSPLSITQFYILFEQTINIMENLAFSPG